jgi:hypothetical protein
MSHVTYFGAGFILAYFLAGLTVHFAMWESFRRAYGRVPEWSRGDSLLNILLWPAVLIMEAKG